MKRVYYKRTKGYKVVLEVSYMTAVFITIGKTTISHQVSQDSELMDFIRDNKPEDLRNAYFWTLTPRHRGYAELIDSAVDIVNNIIETANIRD